MLEKRDDSGCLDSILFEHVIFKYPMCFFDEICIMISQKNTEGVLYLEYNEGFDKLLMTI